MHSDWLAEAVAAAAADDMRSKFAEVQLQIIAATLIVVVAVELAVDAVDAGESAAAAG